MNDTSPLILHGLTKRFGRKLAVNNVSLELSSKIGRASCRERV